MLSKFDGLFVALATDDYAKADQIHIKLMVDHISEVTKLHYTTEFAFSINMSTTMFVFCYQGQSVDDRH